MNSNLQPRRAPRRVPRILGLTLLLFVLAVLMFLARPRSGPIPAGEMTGARPVVTPTSADRPQLRRPPLWGPLTPRPPTTGPTVSGIVYDTGGHPVEGVTLAAMTFEVVGNVPGIVGRAESDRSGHFSLPLPEGTYQLQGSKSGYASGTALARTGEPVSLVLPGGGTIDGHVYDEQHRPIERFDLDVMPAVPGHLAALAPLWSGHFERADGAFTAAPVPAARVVIVKVSAAGRAPAFSSQIMLKPGQTRSIDLTLPRGCVLRGRVVDPRRAPVAYALLDAELQVAAGMGSGAVQAANQIQSDAEGRFQIEHVPLGDVVVRAYDDHHAVTLTKVPVKSCERLEPLQVTLSAGGSLRGVARTGDGAPLADARLTVSHRAIGFLTTRTDARGNFLLARLPAASLRVELESAGQTMMRYVTVKEGEEAHQDLVVPAAGEGEIHGRVTAGGHPMAWVQLQVASSLGPGVLAIHRVSTEANGSYRLPHLRPGAYLVNLISTTRAEKVVLQPGGVASLDLDVIPPPMSSIDDEDDAP